MMGTSTGKLAALGGVMLVTCLAACSSGASPGSSSSAAAGPAATPQLVSPKTLHGSAGIGPQVISSPARVSGGKVSSQKVVLSDRTLIITSVTSQQGTSQSSILIDLDLVVRNTSGKAIQNEAAFFELIGAEGDAFGNQGNNSSDNFYGTIAAHASRSGTIEFEIPTATVSNLYLLYRPEIAKETVLTRLKIG
jgi:Domain of unknown function (DUF4352)